MKEYQDKEWLQSELRKHTTLAAIAKDAKCSQDAIRYWLKKNNIEYTPGTNRRHTLNDRYFKSIDTEEKAYWLGFIMADGCVTANSKDSLPTRLDIILKREDRSHLEKLKRAMEFSGPIIDGFVEDKRGFTTYKSEIKVNSMKLCGDLNRWGIVRRKTGKEYIPDIPNYYIVHFIRGFFDGDGSAVVSANKKFCRFKIGSSSLKIIKQIQSFFKGLGVDINYYADSRYRVPFYVIESNRQDLCNNIYQILYSKATVYLDRKYELVKKYCPPMQECVENKAENCWKESQQPAAELVA